MSTILWAQSEACPSDLVMGYYEDGTLRFVAECNCHDQFDGRYVEYTHDGNLYGMGQFTRGVKTGMWTVYPRVGDITYVAYYNRLGNRDSAVVLENDLVVEVRQFRQ